MKKPVFTPAFLEQYLEEHGSIGAATADFHTDELRRLQQLYATWRAIYHSVQMAETEGVRFVTVESLTQTVRVDVGGIDFDLFAMLVEPIIKKLSGLERQIVAMTADLPNLQDQYSPTPETEAILALCLPQPSLSATFPSGQSSQVAA